MLQSSTIRVKYHPPHLTRMVDVNVCFSETPDDDEPSEGTAPL